MTGNASSWLLHFCLVVQVFAVSSLPTPRFHAESQTPTQEAILSLTRASQHFTLRKNSPTRPVFDSLETQLDKILTRAAQKWNVSFSLGLYNDSVSIAIAKGINNHRTGSFVDTDSLYPMGSVTKTYTAAAAMQLAEKGLLDLDAPIAKYVDPILTRLNGTTLADLFAKDPRIVNATTRQFLQMRSGMLDYEDDKMELWTIGHPDGTYTPLDYINNVTKTLGCTPGDCGLYSSTGYDVVGLALAQVTGAKDWIDFDQRSVLPTAFAAKFNRTIFPTHGKCTAYPNIVHQYHVVSGKEGFKGFMDLDNYSCTNGWTMGNIAAPPLEVAAFYYNLLGDSATPIVSDASRAEMLHWIPLGSKSWSDGLMYGLGLMNYTSFGNVFLHIPNASFEMVGHGGADWGSQAMISGYSEPFHVGLCLAMNAQIGMNFTLNQTGDLGKNGKVRRVSLCSCHSHSPNLSTIYLLPTISSRPSGRLIRTHFVRSTQQYSRRFRPADR